MAILAKLEAQARDQKGSANMRRMRKAGRTPGNIFGHHIAPVMISVEADSLENLIHGGSKVVEINVDGKTEQAIFREIQWDTFGVVIQHFDLLRIDPDERVTVEVTVELRGNAPGVAAGGILDQHLRTISLECRAIEIPNSIIVRIGELQIGQAIHVSDLDIPQGMEVHNVPDTVVVQVVEPVAEAEEPAAGEGGPAEPEVIGKKPEEAEEE
jgi:large subunit ribosomal protein L25